MGRYPELIMQEILAGFGGETGLSRRQILQALSGVYKHPNPNLALSVDRRELLVHCLARVRPGSEKLALKRLLDWTGQMAHGPIGDDTRIHLTRYLNGQCPVCGRHVKPMPGSGQQVTNWACGRCVSQGRIERELIVPPRPRLERVNPGWGGPMRRVQGGRIESNRRRH